MTVPHFYCGNIGLFTLTPALEVENQGQGHAVLELMDPETDGRTRLTDRLRERQKRDGQIDREIDKGIDGQIDRKMHGQMD